MNRLVRRLSRAIRSPIHRRAAFKVVEAFHARPRTLEETVALAMDFGTRGAFRVTSAQKVPEITALARAVAALAPEVILEIGTYRGGTLFLWAQLARECVVSVDLRDLRRKIALFRTFRPPGSRVEIHIVCGDSHEPGPRAEVQRALGGRPVDFLFIDGDHTEAGVEADHRDYAPLVRPGGLIAFHDIAQRQPSPSNQVQRFWTRLKTEADRAEEFIDEPGQCGYGIGVVRA